MAVDQRLQNLTDWLQKQVGINFSRIEPASADASFRRYFRVYDGNNSYIVMDAPPEKESCAAFIDITKRLLDCGVSAPQIEAADRRQGFLLLKDFGDHLYLDVLADSNAEQLYGEAMSSLLKMQMDIEVDGLPFYDDVKLMAEMALFKDWLLKQHLQQDLSAQEDQQLQQCFVFLKEKALQQPQVFVHRDYHSRNLLRLEQGGPGILDYQDAVIGPVSYDLVSLLKDCYISWPAEQVVAWASGFYKQSGLLQSELGQEDFIRYFHLMGVQRHLKASGIFARLHHRDGKPGYLKDIERTLTYITALSDPPEELSILIKLINGKIFPVLAEVNRQCL